MLKDQLDQLRNLHFDSGKIEFDVERIAYETTIKQLKNKINELDINIRIKISEYEELKMFNAEKLRESNYLKFSTSNLKGNLDNNNEDIKEKLIKVENQKLIMEGEITQLRLIIQTLNSELEKLHYILEERKVERNSLIDQVKLFNF